MTMQNEPTLQGLRKALDGMGKVAAQGDATRRALVRAQIAEAERKRLMADQDAKARGS